MPIPFNKSFREVLPWTSIVFDKYQVLKSIDDAIYMVMKIELWESLRTSTIITCEFTIQ